MCKASINFAKPIYELSTRMVQAVIEDKLNNSLVSSQKSYTYCGKKNTFAGDQISVPDVLGLSFKRARKKRRHLRKHD